MAERFTEAGLDNRGLDLYLDAPVLIQQAENAGDLHEYFELMLEAGVPKKEAEKVYRMSMNSDDAETFFADRKRNGKD